MEGGHIDDVKSVPRYKEGAKRGGATLEESPG